MTNRWTKCKCGKRILWEDKGWSTDTSKKYVCSCGRVYMADVDERVEVELREMYD